MNKRQFLREQEWIKLHRYTQTRGVKLGIGYEDFVIAIEVPCWYCKSKTNYLNQITTIKPRLGIVKGNIRTICGECAKGLYPYPH